MISHKILSKGIKGNQAKVDMIDKLPALIFLIGFRSFLGNIRFYRWFIKVFSIISRSLCEILNNEVNFQFDGECFR